MLTTKLERTAAFLEMSVGDWAVLPQNARELFTLDVELPRIHPFGRRCIHCQATLSSVCKTAEGKLEVVIIIQKMQFIPAPERAMSAAMSACSGGERIQ